MHYVQHSINNRRYEQIISGNGKEFALETFLPLKRAHNKWTPEAVPLIEFDYTHTVQSGRLDMRRVSGVPNLHVYCKPVQTAVRKVGQGTFRESTNA